MTTFRMLAAALCILASRPALADDADIVILNWFDHVTFGAINTVTGGAVAGGYVVKGALKGNTPGSRIDSSGKQVVVQINAPEQAFAIGPFHFEGDYRDSVVDYSDTDRHESIHGVQSGILGPTQGLFQLGWSHLAHERQPMETWASAWGNYLSSSRVGRQALDLKLTAGDLRGARARYTLFERSSRLETLGADEDHVAIRDTGKPDDTYTGTSKNPEYPVQVRYAYGQIGAGIAQDCARGGTDVSLEATLFQRDFLGEWKLITPALRLLADSKQEVGAFEINVSKGTVDADLISHVLGYGVRVGDRRAVALDVVGRGGYGLKGKWGEADSPGLVPYLAIGYEGKIHLLDQAELSYRADKEYGTGGYRLDRKTLSAGTPTLFQYKTFTGKHGKDGAPRPVYGAVSVSDENEQGQRTRLLILDVGGRW